mmetsp:Transcript_5636/g.19156  ORF Transcript_5636/g.19156 Transcript_5636/m.19156 type:complete len:246 (+) Transcript_5636:553-1290(+)
MDAVRHPGVPRPGDHPEQGARQGGGLVGHGHPRLRDARGVPALLRRGPTGHLPEDLGGQDQVPLALRPPLQGPHQEAPHRGPDQAHRQPQGRRGGHQEAQVVHRPRLGPAPCAPGGRAHRPGGEGQGRHLQLRQVPGLQRGGARGHRRPRPGALQGLLGTRPCPRRASPTPPRPLAAGKWSAGGGARRAGARVQAARVATLRVPPTCSDGLVPLDRGSSSCGPGHCHCRTGSAVRLNRLRLRLAR